MASKAIARLTIERAVGVKTIVEVHSDATFSRFYHFYTQDGRKRSTKKMVRTANRNEGLRAWFGAHRMTPGLDVIAEQFRKMPHVTSAKVRIIRKRAYRKVLEAAPDALGMARTVSCLPESRHWQRQSVPAFVMPSTFTPMKKRFDIVTGR